MINDDCQKPLPNGIDESAQTATGVQEDGGDTKSANKITQTDNQQRGDEDDKNLKYYDIKKHRSIIILIIIAVFLGTICLLPWVIGAIELIFRLIPCWEDGENGNCLNTAVLPDFLGGMAGILVGFIIEWQLFSRLKILSKYGTLLGVLKIELEMALGLLDGALHKIEIIALDDVVTIAENSTVFQSLPFQKERERVALYKQLLTVHSKIKEYVETRESYVKTSAAMASGVNESLKKRCMGLIEPLKQEIEKFLEAVFKKEKENNTL